MKFYLEFVIIVAFSNVGTFSHGSRDKVLQKALVDIVEALSKQDYLLSIVLGSSSEDTYSAPLALTAEIPHIVAKLDNEENKLKLNSSAIVILDSVASLNAFNKRTVIPSSFPRAKQLFISLHNGTFAEIESQINTTDAITGKVVPYQYFIVLAEKTVKLLTFVYPSTGNRFVAKLVEVNRFNRT